MKKLVALLVLAGIGLVGAVYWFTQRGQASGPQIRKEAVDRGPVIERVSATGRVAPKDIRIVGIDLPAARVKTVFDISKVGNYVPPEEPLLQLDDEKAQDQLKVAEKAVKAAEAAKANAEGQKRVAEEGVKLAKATQDRAKAELARVEAIHMRTPDAVNKATVDSTTKAVDESTAGVTVAEERVKTADLAIQAAELDIQKAKAAEAAAKQAVNSMVVKSPIAGFIIDRQVEPGQVISPQATPVLFVIAPDLHRMQVLAQVGESDIRKVKLGQMVRFSVDAYGDDNQYFFGRVSHKAEVPTALPNRATSLGGVAASAIGPVLFTVSIDVIPTSWDGWLVGREFRRLQTGWTANVDIVVRQVDDALRVPSAATNFRPDKMDDEEQRLLEQGMAQGKRPVWVAAKEGKPKLVMITAGASDGARLEVIKADGDYLQAGQEVIIESIPVEKTGLFDKPVKVGL